MGKTGASLLLRVITAVIAWYALGLQQYILLDGIPKNGFTPLGAIARFLIFFTILSNLLVAISLTISILNPKAKFFQKPSVQAAIALYIIIVGLVYNLLLRQTWNPQGSQKIADELLHVVVPLLYMIYWIVFVPKQGLQWKHIFYWLVFPAVYLVYALIRGAAEGFYPYPFLDVSRYGYGTVLVNSAVMLMGFLVIGSLLLLIARKRYKRQG